MKRIRILVLLMVLLMLNGCEREADIPFSESNAPPGTAAASEEMDPGRDADVFYQVVIREIAEEAESKDPEVKPEVALDIPDNKQFADEKAGSSEDSSSQPVNDLAEESLPEGSAFGEEPEQPEDPPQEEPEAQSDPEPDPSEVTPPEEPDDEPEAEPEPAFDIGSWITYAKSTAKSLGLELDPSAVDCWDNPITANPDCIYLERDITARLRRYAGDEDITAVWIWNESTGENSHLIYIGYA